MSATLLVVDEDKSFTALLSQYLASEGFELTVVHDGETAIKKALNQSFDAILLDVLLPKLNGFDVLEAIRQHSNVPIIILSAKQDNIDRLVGFERGADDYLTKPCNPHELIARIRTILRRAPKSPPPRPLLQHGPITLDGTKRTATLNNKPLELTNTEFNILDMLLKSPGQAFSKEELTEYALGRKFTAYDRSIDVHISNLRNKLGRNEQQVEWIKTVRGFGYVFND